MAQDNGYAFVEVQEDGTKTICIECWFEAQPSHGMSFDTRPKPDRESMWVHCQMHRSRMGHTTTNRGLAAIGLGVRSTTTAGLAGGSVATGTITVPKVIDDCMSPQRTDSSEDETDPPATHGTRFPTFKSLTRYRVDTDNFMTLLPEGWSIRSTVWLIVLGKREEDSLLVINLFGKVVQYNLISKTLHDIFDYGSNQLDDNHNDDDDELLQQLEAEHNIYEFILSFARV
ncbi:hypothetical protein Tco_0747347 [Tanacetum coccineum]|uniref:Uncharacterized protein n=1 Tax=Tanacetum coccineum TaxID=301880 RepID=A0ABQ4YV04_9ASTR